MEMKAKTNRRASKTIIIVALVLVLLTLVSTMSYAWIRNYVSVEKIEMTTGKMLYRVSLVQKNSSGDFVVTELFDTGTDNAKKVETIEVAIKNSAGKIDVEAGKEVFFVVQKYNDSIDLDATVSFEKDGNPADYEYMGQTWFKMEDVSSQLSLTAASTDAQIATAVSQLVTSNQNFDEASDENMNTIWDVAQRMRSLENTNSISVVRMKFFEKNETKAPSGTSQTFPLKIKFAVAQKGGFEEGGQRWDVKTYAQLKQFMDEYNINDELYLNIDTSSDVDIVWDGDMVFSRPCKITLVRTTLQINGNLIFSYDYDGKYVLNTISEGHIKVMKTVIATETSTSAETGSTNTGTETVISTGGNFQIELPNSAIDLKGANNAATGMADVYVEGDFEVSAAKTDKKGVSIEGLRVCELDETLKPLIITNDTRLSTTNRTTLGKVTAKTVTSDYAFSLEIINKGTIEQIDLTGMTEDPTLLDPCIKIDNRGTIGKYVNGDIYGDTDTIRLPSWSKRYNATTKEGNTYIAAGEGSNDIKALSVDSRWLNSDNSIAWSKIDSSSTINFISNRDLLDLLNGRDDIERGERTVFIDVIQMDGEGDPINVVIHYEEPTSSAIAARPDLNLNNLKNKSLREYVEFYGYDHTKFVKVKIICYGTKVLCGDARKLQGTSFTYAEDKYEDQKDDYAFIREMTALESLDLSEAVSATKEVEIYDENHLTTPLKETHKAVPAGAFGNMKNLSSIIMSENDTLWEPYIFMGTKVDTITFPQALTRLLNPRNSTTSGANKGTVKSQDVLEGIDYVYTSITKVEGVWANSSTTQYFFTPDEVTYNFYLGLNTDSRDWFSKVFMNYSQNEKLKDIGVVRLESMFLRYDPTASKDNRICEFVVQTNSTSAWYSDAKSKYDFDFGKITIGGNEYKIVSYDSYSLYKKLNNESGLVSITFGEKLESIGEYAFAENADLGTVTFGNTDTKLLGHTFFNDESLTSVYAPEITTLEGGYNFAKNDNFVSAKKDALLTFYMPKLSVVTDGNDLRGCLKLDRVDIGVIEYTESNKTFYSASSSSVYDTFNYAKFYIHTENAQPRENITFNKALAADYRYIFVNGGYEDLYTATSTYTGVASIGNNSLDAIKETVVDGVKYYYYLDSGNACLVACLEPSIDKSNQEEYVLVDKLDGYTINKIGDAAYHFTAIKARSIKIPDAITEIGRYAFDARKNDFKKYCITLNLNKVVKADVGAFYYVDMVRLIGDKLEEVATETLSNNKSLIVANLPALSRSQPADETVEPPKVFVGATALRIAYTSYSDDIRYDNNSSRTMGYIRFVNYPVEAAKFVLPDVNTVIGGIVATPTTYSSSTLACNYVNTDKNYSDIYYSDFYECKFNFNGQEESIMLPGYFYYKEESGDMTLMAVSPDISEFGDWDGIDYTTPNNLYLDADGKYTSVSNGSDVKFKVTKIGRFAYGFVKFSLNGDVIIGDNISIIDVGGFKNCAYSTSGTQSTLNIVKCLDLANVVTLKDSACHLGNMETLNAPMLKEVGEYAFRQCKKLITISLPSFERTTGTAAFWYCSGLEEVTVGERAKQFLNNTFLETPKLTKLTILNETEVVIAPTNLTNTGSNVKVHVYKGILAAYKAKYTSSFGGISIDNFETFGEVYLDGNVMYSWNKLDDVAKTAYISAISGTFPEDGVLEIPSEIEGYKVIAVYSSAMSALSGVKEVVLPDSMETFTFTAGDLADSVTTLSIAGTNTFFKTVDGVLYSKDGTILYAYPKAKADETFDIVAGDGGVTQIFDRAFSGAKLLRTLNIKNGALTINDRAFENVVLLSNVNFESATPSAFVGWDITSGANVHLKFTVPTGKLNDYKANVMIDYSIIDKFAEKQ